MVKRDEEQVCKMDDWIHRSENEEVAFYLLRLKMISLYF